jgi:hypothetical protein
MNEKINLYWFLSCTQFTEFNPGEGLELSFRKHLALQNVHMDGYPVG